MDNNFEMRTIEEEVMGFGGDDLSMLTSGLSELVKAGGQAGAKAMSDKDNAAKAADAKKKADAAQQAQLDAQLALMAASQEKDPNGPLHQAALVKQAAAAKAAAAAGVALLPTGAPGAKHDNSPSFLTRSSAGVPNWAWVIGGTFTAGGVIALVVHLMRKK